MKSPTREFATWSVAGDPPELDRNGALVYESGRESKLNVLSCERNDQLGGSPCDLGNNREAQHEYTSTSSLPHSI
jgi:hypothetical protein